MLGFLFPEILGKHVLYTSFYSLRLYTGTACFTLRALRILRQVD